MYILPQRMNVQFDQYQYESEFVKDSAALVKQLIVKRIAREEP